MTAEVRAGLLLTEAALGVGVLLLPPITVEAGAGAPWSWVLCGVLGLLVGYIAAGAARATDTATPVMKGWYAAGTVVGQGFICWIAVAYLLHAGRTGTFLAALALVAVAGLAAVAVRRVSTGTRRIRLGLTAAVVLVWAVWPDAVPFDATVLGTRPSTAAQTAFLLLISAVGWESSRTIIRTARPVVALAFAGMAVLAMTAGLTGLRVLRADAGSAPAVVGPILAVAVAALAASYCMTNLQFAGRLAGELVSGTPRRAAGVAAVTVGAALVMGLAMITGAGAWQLLLGPGAMTAAIFAVITVRAVGDGRTRTAVRVVAALAAVLVAVLAVTAWQALAFPLVTAAVVVVWSRGLGRRPVGAGRAHGE